MLNIRLRRLLNMADVMAMLSQMRSASGDMDTIGLPDHVILEFASLDKKGPSSPIPLEALLHVCPPSEEE